jgi:hypothetical protein
MVFHTAKVSYPEAKKTPRRPQNILMEKTEERMKEEKTL